MLQEFFRGFIKIHILYHAAKGSVYGLEMAAELRRHGYENISPGTLYPALHRLEGTGYLAVERRLDAGRWRKYYTLTPKGKEALQQIRVKLRELADEVLAL
jgi:DNA-binding PadR family transcriptional regulator